MKKTDKIKKLKKPEISALEKKYNFRFDPDIKPRKHSNEAAFKARMEEAQRRLALPSLSKFLSR